MDFWHGSVTDISFSVLQELRKEIPFILIGGWAVYFHTKMLKSKDIDIIVEFEALGTLKKSADVQKNERLKKYEIHREGFDIDIYVPGWSQLGIPIDYIRQHTISLSGFILPAIEIMIILKLRAYRERKGSLKGQKDMIDIASLIFHPLTDIGLLMGHLKELTQEEAAEELKELLDSMIECPELSLNQKQYSDAKRRVKPFFEA